jgi:hypothetical protein
VRRQPGARRAVWLLLAALQGVLPAAVPLADALLHRPAAPRALAKATPSARQAAPCALCDFVRTPLSPAPAAEPPSAVPVPAGSDAPGPAVHPAVFVPGSPPARGPPRSSPAPSRG